MAYPSNKIPEPDNVALLFDEEKLNQLVELFPRGDDAMERLRLHYLEVVEGEPDDEELKEEKANGNGKAPAPKEILPASETLRGETIDAVGLYLKEMSRVPLLSNEEEISLAKRIEKAKKAERKLANLNGRTPKAEKQALKDLVIDGRAARNHLIQANTRLVVSIAKKYLGRGVPFLDLIQEGNLGLMKAVKKYESLTREGNAPFTRRRTRRGRCQTPGTSTSSYIRWRGQPKARPLGLCDHQWLQPRCPGARPIRPVECVLPQWG